MTKTPRWLISLLIIAAVIVAIVIIGHVSRELDKLDTFTSFFLAALFFGGALYFIANKK